MLITSEDHREAIKAGEQDQRADMNRCYRERGMPLELIESRFRGQVRHGTNALAAWVDPRAVAAILRDEAERVDPAEAAACVVAIEQLGRSLQAILIKSLFAAGFDSHTIAAFTNCGLAEADVERLRTVRVVSIEGAPA